MPFYKSVFLILSLYVLAGGSAVVEASTNSKLQQSAFFAKTNLIEALISPNGKHVLLLKNEGDTQQVVLRNPLSKQQRVVLNLNTFAKNKTEAKISDLLWIDNRHFAAQYSEERKGLADFANDGTVHTLLIVDVGAPDNNVVVKSVRTKGYLVDPLPATPGQFLYAKPGLYSKVYRLSVDKLAIHAKRLGKLDRIDGGLFTKSREVASIEGIANRWFINGKGEVKAVLHLQVQEKAETLVLSTLNPNREPTQIKSWLIDELNDEKNRANVFMPYALTDKPNVFFGFGLTETDRRSVFEIDYKADTHKVVFQTGAFKLVDLLIDKVRNKLVGAEVINNGRIEFVYLDNIQTEALANTAYAKASQIIPIGGSLDRLSVLFFVASHNQPGRIVFLHRPSNTVTQLGGYLPQLNDNLDAKQSESKIEVDGSQVHYLLNMPAKTRNPLPLIVMPHGGPFGIFDNANFNRDVQYLVNRGFAVLRVNFRGSGGYSETFEQAGKKQWGSGMIDDIYAATEHVIAEQNIDQKKVCAAGMSYGGYAALMLVIRYGQLYKCAVSMSGVTDINLHLSSTQHTKKQRQWSKEHIGDPELEYDILKQISPVYLSDKINRPVFIQHGAKDTIVDIEQAYRLKLMLDKQGKPYKWLINPDAGHDYGTPEQYQALFEQVADFVNKQLNVATK